MYEKEITLIKKEKFTTSSIYDRYFVLSDYINLVTIVISSNIETQFSLNYTPKNYTIKHQKHYTHCHITYKQHDIIRF